MSGTDHRRLVGASGERLARLHLEARGFEVLEANFRTRHGELDLVAADERCLVFCEVKTRVVARAGGAAGGRVVPAGRAGAGRGAGPGAGAGAGPLGELGPFAAIGPGKRRQVRLMAREWLAARRRTAPRREELRFDAIGIELDLDGRLLSLEHLEGAF